MEKELEVTKRRRQKSITEIQMGEMMVTETRVAAVEAKRREHI